MCGITGWIHYAEQLTDKGSIIEKMARALTNRGPDAEGYWTSDHALLGHRRLIVVDPEGGAQPMTLTHGAESYVMVYNGELYNTEDIRKDLLAKGHTFHSWSDTEVLLHAYAEWGEQCLERLNGIFAFAVWEEKNERLFLARDRIGVKPLFYSEQGKSFLFASEIKAIFKHPAVLPRLSGDGLAEIFALGPARTPGHGVIDAISELRPGYCMMVGRNGVRVKQYWSLTSHPHEDSFEQTVLKVKELVYDSVKRQLVSDVPLCVLLSGGLDSSAIAAIAVEVYQKERNEKIRTFSIDYVDNDKNFRPGEFQPNPDAPWVKTVSEFLGTKHMSFFIDTPELTDALFPAVLARDLPGMADIDSSLLLFSALIKKQATVGLSGECADEVFGGYPWFYRQAAKDTFPWSQRLNERVRVFSPELMHMIRPYEYVAERYREALDEVPRDLGDTPEENKMRELFYLNLTRWMPTLLDRKDRMSMAAGVELRVPFCDHRLVEYVWNVPWSFKYYNEREKGLLRLALTGLLPEEVLWRKKSPYPKTHNPDYIDALRGLTLRMLDDASSPLHPLISKQNVRELAQSMTRDTNIPWFGQLMNAPQLLAYLLQIDYWMREYHISII
jgi:asparagine synthase (glutamine-hydrolysing)